MSSCTISILAPLVSEQRVSEQAWQSWLHQTENACQLWIYSDRAPERDVPDTVHWVKGRWTHLAALLNQAFREIPAQFVLYIHPQVILDPECISTFREALISHPGASYGYSDYCYAKGPEIRLIDDPGDITERQDWGQLFVVRREAVLQKGGVDEENPDAVFYDLRLKLSDEGPLLHIPEVLYQVPAPKASEGDKGYWKLFFPGQGQYGGFSYLFYTPEQERQFEQVFYHKLKRRGCYLDRIPPIIPPDSGRLASPAVSVLIPVYNRSEFIGSAVESVLSGTFHDFEILVIDNGSTDGTLRMVEKYNSNSRVTLLHCPENVIAKSLNTGLRASQGRYIAQLDSDDEYAADTLSAMVGYLEDHPSAGLAISYYELMDVEGNTLEEFGVITHSEYNRNNILRVDGAGAVRVWRKSVLKELGGFDEETLGGYGEDYDLVLKVSERYEVGRVHRVLYRYRRHPGNTDALVDNTRKIRAKSIARQQALCRRQKLNQLMAEVKSM
jgi:hypothetical protein